MLFDDELTVYIRGKMLDMLSRRMYSRQGLQDKITGYVANARKTGRPMALAGLLEKQAASPEADNEQAVAQIITAALMRMEDQGLLNDFQYAQAVMRSEVFYKHRSLMHAKMKLRTLKISDEVIEKVMTDVDYTALRKAQLLYVRQLIDKALLNAEGDTLDQKAKRRLIAKAMRRGVPYDVICGAING